jgi:hypothetical protein
LGHWSEINEEIMQLLNRYEPQGEVYQKNSLFLPFHRKKDHIILCTSKYLHKRALHM